MYAPKNPHIPTPPTKKLKLFAAITFAGAIALCIAVISLSVLLVQKSNRLKAANDDIALLSNTLERMTDELTKTRRVILSAQALPALDSFNEQCPGGNQENGLFTLLNTTPVEGYNVVAVTCRQDLAAGISKPRILLFRVNTDGTKEFTYASGDNEPPCIPSKVPVANAIATRLEMSVCAKS